MEEYKENTSFLDFFRHFEHFWKEKFSVYFPLFILRKKFMSHRPMSKIFDVIKSSSEVMRDRVDKIIGWRIDFRKVLPKSPFSHFSSILLKFKKWRKNCPFFPFCIFTQFDKEDKSKAHIMDFGINRQNEQFGKCQNIFLKPC